MWKRINVDFHIRHLLAQKERKARTEPDALDHGPDVRGRGQLSVPGTTFGKLARMMGKGNANDHFSSIHSSKKRK